MQKEITVKDVLGKCTNTFDMYTFVGSDLEGGEVILKESNGIIFLNKYGHNKISSFVIGNELNEIKFEGERK